MDKEEFIARARVVISAARKHSHEISARIAARKARLNDRLLEQETRSKEAWKTHEQTLGDWKY